MSAFLLLLHLCGREARPNSGLYSAAQSRDQAGILFSLAAKIVRMSPTLAGPVGIRDTKKELYCSELGTVYRALSAEVATSFGLSPAFIVHDELGQVEGPSSDLYEALETATAAQDDPLSIIISTQAPTDADLLSVLIDDAKKGHDPRVKLFLYDSDPEADPFAEETIRSANPAFDVFQNQVEILAMADGARRMPSREPHYRNLILNQRCEASSPFVTPSVWKLNGGDPAELWGDAPVYIGLDLSRTTDLTACVLVAQLEGAWHVRPIFWIPGDEIGERAKRDRVPYDVWARAGVLRLAGGKAVSYEYVAAELFAILSSYHVQKVGFDRWNMANFTPWLIKAGLPEERIEELFQEFGQGYQSMSPALRTLEELLVNGKLRHGNHPVLTMCAANAVVKEDEASGRKLDKKRSHGRIDGMVALTMAIGVSTPMVEEEYVEDPLVVV